MERERITYEESCVRECSVHLAACGDPTAHGLDGYSCENCLAFVASKCDAGEASLRESCGYCVPRIGACVAQLHVPFAPKEISRPLVPGVGAKIVGTVLAGCST